MKALTSSHNGRKFLQISRSNALNIYELKTSRQKLLGLVVGGEIKRLLADCRNANFEGLRAVDVYILIKQFKRDFPNCQRIALLCQSAPEVTLQHYKNASNHYGIDLEVYSESMTAKDWLCSH